MTSRCNNYIKLAFFVKRSRKKEQKSTIEATAKRFFENERTIIKTNIILLTSPTMRKSLHTHKHRFAPKICAAKWIPYKNAVPCFHGTAPIG